MADRVYSAQLVMTADVSQARAQLQSLQSSLDNILRQGHNTSPLGLTSEINNALSKVADLKIALDQAINVNTGKLDLTKFTKSINAGNIQQYADSLKSLGPTGVQAFSQLSRSIMSADIPLRKTNGLVQSLMASMKNVIGWRISTGAFNAVLGTFQKAYGYAQDLNESLNNIRIVTGQSVDQMSKFAQQANKAAKQLSTTTTAYTDAALIFYQQGLNDSEVKKRTDTTIKLANVTGESTQAVSDYMTAVWNNFDDGSKSLEYYADVMTALGAATASSTDEIAAGLEKFAAVAETVGLSYEYATSALATITSETRQSAEVVGNALKTLFARIQGLKLGETLEDGTSLNKYSEALMSVGISVKDQNGELREMDDILNDMGAKWDTLTKDQQTALAQTVAGVRQYTQLIALMDNWDEFKINLTVAEGAEGTLSQQSDIYEESWEAASKRVKASMEDIYDSILNDEFFIDLTNGLSKFLDVIGNTIDGLGGMKGIISAIGLLIFKHFGTDVFKFFTNSAKRAQAEAIALREKTNEAFSSMLKNNNAGFGENVQLKTYQDQYSFQTKILAKQKELEAQGKSLTEEERTKLGIMQQQLDIRSKELVQSAREVESIKNESKRSQGTLSVDEENALRKKYKKRKGKSNQIDYNTGSEDYLGQRESLEKKFSEVSFGENIASKLNSVSGSSSDFKAKQDYLKKLQNSMKEVKIESDKLNIAFEAVFEADDPKKLGEAITNLENTLKELRQEAVQTGAAMTREFSGAEAGIGAAVNRGEDYGNAQGDYIHGKIIYDQGQGGLDEDLEGMSGTAIQAADKFQALGMAISSCAMILSSFKGIIDVINNEDMTFGEKFLAILTTLGSVLPMVAMSFSAYNKEALASISASIKSALGFGTVGASGVVAGAGGKAAAVGIGAASASLWSLLGPIGLVMIALAGLIALLSWIFKDRKITLEDQLEEARKTTAKLNEELENTKNKAEELKTSFEEYNTIVDKLKSCVEGSQAFRDALIEANTASLNLLSTYPQLYDIEGAVVQDENGFIQITKKGQEFLEEQHNKNTALVQNAAIKTQQYQRGIEEDIKIRDSKIAFQEAMDLSNKTSNINKEAVVENLGGSTGWENYASSVSSQGSNLNEIQQGAYEYALSKIRLLDKDQQTEENLKDLMFEHYDQLTGERLPEEEIWDNIEPILQHTNFKEDLNISDLSDYPPEITIDGITESSDELALAAQKLIQELSNNTKQLQLENETMVKNALGNKASYKSDEEISVLSALMANKEKEKYEALITTINDTQSSITTLREDLGGMSIWEKYAEITGKTGYTIGGITNKDGVDYVEVRDAEGNEVDDISEMEIARVVASYLSGEYINSTEASQDMTAILNDLSNISITNQENDTVKGDQFLKDLFIKGDLSNLTQKEIGQLGTMTQEDWDSIIGQMDEETQKVIASKYGMDSVQEVIDQYWKPIYEAAQNFNLDSQVTEWLTEAGVDVSKFTIGVQKQLSDELKQIFSTVGKEGVDSFLTAIEGMDEDDVSKVLSIANTIDWSQGDAQQQFIDRLKEGKILTASNTEALTAFAAAMAEAGGVIPVDKFATFIDQLKEILLLLKDLKVGDIVDENTVMKLQSYGIDISKYFVEGLEGYTMIQELDYEDVVKQAQGEAQLLNNQFNRMYSNSGFHIDKNGKKYTNAEWSAKEAQEALVSEDIEVQKQFLADHQQGLVSNEDYLRAFGISQDDFDNILSNGTQEQIDSAISSFLTFTQGGINGLYTDEAANNNAMLYAASKGDVRNIINTQGFYDSTVDEKTGKTSTTISQDGVTALLNATSQYGEAGVAVLKKYQNEVKNVKVGSKEWHEANEQLAKDMKILENNKVAQNIGKIGEELKDVAKDSEEYNGKIIKIGEEFQTAFGVNLSPDEIKTYLNDILTWAQGGEMSEGLLKLINEKEINDQFAQLQSKYDNFLSGFDDIQPIKDLVISCRGEADFANLYSQLTALGVTAEDAAKIIASMANVDLDVEGMSQLAGYLEKYNAYMEAGLYANAEKVAKDAEGLGINIRGIVPDVEPSLVNTEITNPYQPSGGGGGSDSKNTRQDFNEKRKKVYDDKISRLKEDIEGMEPGSPERLKAEEELNQLYEERAELLKNIGRLLKKEMEAEEKVFEGKHPEFDVKLDDNGAISNLADLYAQIDAEYEKILNEKGIEEATEYLKSIMEDMQPMLDLEDQIEQNTSDEEEQEKERAQEELNRITEAIDWKIKQIDFQIKRLNYYQEKLLLQAHGNKQQIEAMLEGFQYQEQEMLKLFEKGQVIRDGIAELNAAKSQFPDNQQMFNEQILDYQSELIDLNLDILELRKDMEELVQNVLDLALDEIDIQNGRIEKYVSMLDHFNNIIDLSGRKMMDASLKTQIGAMKLDTLINKMSISKQTMEGLLEATNLAQEALEKRRADDDETSVKFWENQVEVLKRELEAAQETFLANWEETLQTASDIFDMRVELAIQTMSDALSPFSSMEVFSDIYAREKEIVDQYLDDATKLYELNKLNRQLNLSIKDENDLLAQSKLRDLQEEIYALQKAGVDMSQYDLEMLQKKYDLRLAEIALMEAQNSKTSMRLVRDAAGNWTYAYDADEQKIEDATQKYEDAMYEMTQKSNEYLNDMSQQLIDIQIEYMEALNNVDKNASDYQYQLIRIQEQYMERYRFTLSELKKSTEDLGLTMHDTLYGSQMDLWSFEDAQNRFTTNSDLTLSELMTNYKDWQAIVEKAMNVAGTSWDNFGTDMGGTLDSLEEHIQALCDEISKLVDVLMGYVAQSIGMVEEWQSKYSKQVDAELAKNEGVFEDDSLHQSGSSSGGRSRMSNIPTYDDFGQAMAYLAENEGASVNIVHKYNSSKDGTYSSIDELGKSRNEVINEINKEGTISTGGWTSTDDIKKNIAKAATGMYTGDWPNSEGMDGMGGKLAILHQKELVLNKTDTENILEAVELARKNQPQQIAKRIDELVEAMQNQTSYTFNNLLTQVKLPLGPDPQELLQNVEIYADFPGVTDQNEIREAFNNLSNEASQYLGIKNRF